MSEDNESGTVQKESVNRSECCLSEDQILLLGNLSLEVHRFYGNPRDIEWGIKDNNLYLLQSRPITNLENWSDWEAMHDMDSGQQSENEYLSRANVGEVFPGSTSHLGLSWMINLMSGNGFVSRLYSCIVVIITYIKFVFYPYRKRGEKC